MAPPRVSDLSHYCCARRSVWYVIKPRKSQRMLMVLFSHFCISPKMKMKMVSLVFPLSPGEIFISRNKLSPLVVVNKCQKGVSEGYQPKKYNGICIHENQNSSFCKGSFIMPSFGPRVGENNMLLKLLLCLDLEGLSNPVKRLKLIFH